MRKRKAKTELVTADGKLFAWPFRPSRDRLVTLATSETLNLLLGPSAWHRARGAARLTRAQFVALFDRPRRWINLARAARRVEAWQVEKFAEELGEKRLLHCVQGRSRSAFIARFAGALDEENACFRRKRRRR